MWSSLEWTGQTTNCETYTSPGENVKHPSKIEGAAKPKNVRPNKLGYSYLLGRSSGLFPFFSSPLNDLTEGQSIVVIG